MNLRYLLDTSTLSAVIAPKPDRNVVTRLGQRGSHCAIASVVWNELVYGLNRLPEGKRKTELEAFLYDVVLKSFPILPYSEEEATWHGIERARQVSVGRPGPFVDGQIAAVACVNSLTLVTANVMDFTRFEDLRVEDWTRSKRDR